MRMRKLDWRIGLGAGLALSLAWAAGASAKTIYSWRTEDGVYAFTDDPRAIPARYRDEATTRTVNGLAEYERHTSQVPGANDSYATALEARLERLRALNAQPATPLRNEGVTAGGGNGVSLRVGGGDAPRLQVTPSAGGGPVVIENRVTKPDGKSVTRESTIVTRDGRVIAIVRPRSRETNINAIEDEADLLR